MPIDNPSRIVVFSTRNLRQEHLDKMRVIAALQSSKIGKPVRLHDVHNQALARGLAQLEKEMKR